MPNKLDELNLEGQDLGPVNVPEDVLKDFPDQKPWKLPRHLARRTLQKEEEIWSHLSLGTTETQFGIKVETKSKGTNLRTRLYHARTYLAEYAWKEHYPERCEELRRYSLELKNVNGQWWVVLNKGPAELILEPFPGE